MRISINGISSKIIIGCYDYERTQEQDIIIDLWAELYQSNRDLSDNINATIDYDDLVDFIQERVSSTRYHLLESLSSWLTGELLNKYPLIRVAHINIVKPAICGLKAQHINVSHTQERRFRVALALGSNDALAQQQLITAIEILGEYVSDIQIGGFYLTLPFGYAEQNNFVNTALIGYVSLRPEELLGKIKTIEKLMGKHEVFINGPRCIDIDLILYADLIYQHNFLTVPHTSAHLRDFVLKPLADIDANWVHPGQNKTIGSLLQELKDSSILEKLEYNK